MSQSSQLQVARPPFNPGRQAIQYPWRVTIKTRPLFQILSHALRRKPDQKRMIGTLVGVRSDDGNEVIVKHAYIVPADEDGEEIQVDVDYHREMYALLLKAYPECVIVGWYSLSSELDNLSGLLNDFYAQDVGTFPYPPILLTMQTTEAADLDICTYVSSPIGVPSVPSTGNNLFLPIQHVVEYNQVDKAALQLVRHAAVNEKNGYTAEILSTTTCADETTEQVLEELESVQAYVQMVLSGRASADHDVGKSLFRTLSQKPVLAPKDSDLLGRTTAELQAVVQLTKTVRSQLHLTSNLTTML